MAVLRYSSTSGVEAVGAGVRRRSGLLPVLRKTPGWQLSWLILLLSVSGFSLLVVSILSR